MKHIEIFEADDGTQFNTATECLQYEEVLRQEKEVEKLIYDFTSSPQEQAIIDSFLKTYMQELKEILCPGNIIYD